MNTYQSFSVEEVSSIIIKENDFDEQYPSKKILRLIFIMFSVFLISITFRLFSKCL